MKLLIMPGSPALVSELAPRDRGAAVIVEAVRGIIEETCPTAIELVGSRDEHLRTAHTGSFKAWGRDVPVAAGEFLPELVANYVLGERWSPLVSDSRGSLGFPAPDALTMVVLDGSAGLTDQAPLSLLPGAEEVHTFCRDLVAGHAVAPVPEGELGQWLREGGVMDPALWVELYHLAAGASPGELSARCLAAEAPLGVGRYVGIWQSHSREASS